MIVQASLPSFDGSRICILSIYILAVGGALSIVYRFFHHPLRHIPGSLAARISNAPLFWQSLSGNRIRWIMREHEKYGPVIRIAPNKVCVSADEGIKAIYNNKTSKSSAYAGFRYHQVKMCIGLLDVKSAHVRRKGLLPAFSRQNLNEMEPIIRFHLTRFLGWLEQFDQREESVDCFKWFRYLTFDVVTDIAFGQQLGMLVKEDDHFIKQVEFRNKRNGLVGEFHFS